MTSAPLTQPRPRVGPGVAVGVDEPMIREVVHAFYADVRRDPELGPIFERAIADWDDHLVKLCDFWSSVLLMTGRFKGRPMEAHARLPEIDAPHFTRWLALFRETVERLCPPPAAALFVDRSQMIARSLQLGLAVSRGAPPLSTLAAAPRGPTEAPLPPDVTPYARTAEFTEATIPPGLLKAHTTKADAWGLIRVLEGRLVYRIIDPRRPASERVLTPSTPPGVVEPTVLHEVRPLGPVRFYVEFLRRDSTPARA